MNTLLIRYFLLLALWCIVSALPEKHVEFRLSDWATSYRRFDLSGRSETFVIDVITRPVHEGKAQILIGLPDVYQSLSSISVDVDLEVPDSVQKYFLLSLKMYSNEHREVEADRMALITNIQFGLYRLDIDIKQPGFKMTLRFSGEDTELIQLANQKLSIRVNTGCDRMQSFSQSLQSIWSEFDERHEGSSSSRYGHEP